MAQIFNQYSFIVSAAFLLIVLGGVLFSSRQRKRAWIVLAAVAVAIGISWAAIRPEESSVGTQAALAMIGSGTPVLVEFQSPF